MFFNLPTAYPSDCSTWTYRLYESITGDEIDPSLFFVETDVSIPFVRFTLPSRDPWLFNSPFELTLKATFKPYGHVVSDPIEVTVRDTCFNTKFTP